MARSRRRRLPEGAFPAEVTALAPDGRGVARVEGREVLIAGALPGEEVTFEYVRKSRRFDEGRVLAVTTPSPDRQAPRCPHVGACGGCSLQHLRPVAQVAVKERALLDAFASAGVAPERVLSPLMSPDGWGYRTKARLGVKWVRKKGRVLVGFRERYSGLVADIDHCEVLDPKVGGLITPLAALVGGLSVRERLPQIEVAVGDEGCALVLRLLERLEASDLPPLRRFESDHGVIFYTQEGGPETVVPLFGEPAGLHYRLPSQGVRIAFEPGDFTQVNIGLNRLMVERALELLDPGEEERVIDLFCGLGNFTLPVARRAGSAVGVEGDAALVERARRNAAVNHVANVDFFPANLYDAPGSEPWASERYDKALLDPPRSGALEVVQLLPRLGVERIVYVSCFPDTLARDAGELVNRQGYRLAAAGVMDMFPHTAHVESIALFERR